MQLLANGPTVLVAEDEAEVRSFLEVALQCYGYTVRSTEDGEEALDILSESGSEISAVLLDLIMPRRSGMEVLGEIRKLYEDLP